MPTMRQIGSMTAGSIAPGATGGPLYLTKNGAGAPPYSFAGDTDTGMDSSGADAIILVAGGTTRFTLNTTGMTTTVPHIAPIGTAAACGFAFAGSLGDGMFQDANAWIGIANDGVQALAIDGSGFFVRNDMVVGWNNGALPVSAPDLKLTRTAPAIMCLSAATLTTGATLEMYEQTAPAAGAANSCRLYCVDAAGKTQLRAIFNTGASQLIAAEP